MKISGKHIIIFIFFILVWCEKTSAQVSQRNIVLIIVDDLNDYTGFLGGHPQAETPEMDKLAEESIVFENAYCTSPVCAPSRTSFMSGKDAYYTRVYNNAQTAAVFRDNFKTEYGNETVITLLEYLKDNGYYTVGINKIYDLPGSDYDKTATDKCLKTLSWNEYIHISDSIILSYSAQLNQGFEADDLTWGILPDSLADEMADTKAVTEAISILNEYSEGTYNTCDKKLFMAVGISNPHVPLFIPASYYLPYYVKDFYNEPFILPYNFPDDAIPFNGVVMPPQPESAWADYYALPADGVAVNLAKSLFENFINFGDTITPLPLINDTLTIEHRKLIMSESKRANDVMAYLAGVKYADEQIGRLLNAIKENPALNENTIIILLSDNGYSLGEKNHWTKTALWETDVRVPFVIHTPDNYTARIKTPVSLLDLFPTVCDLADVAPPLLSDGTPYTDGLSLVPLFTNELAYGNERVILSSVEASNNEGSCFPQYSMRNRTSHYLKYASGFDDSDCVYDETYDETEFYEIGAERETDPNEWNNLTNDINYDSTKNTMEQWLPGGTHYMEAIEPLSENAANEESTFEIFPNPAQYDLHFIADVSNPVFVSIFELSGKPVLERMVTADAKHIHISVADLPSGLYIVKISSGETISTSRFIKL